MSPLTAFSVTSVSRNVLVVVLFLALAACTSFPLLNHLSDRLTGIGYGDNVAGLWNFWWMRESLASHASFLFSPMLFHPAGFDLTLHTHTALPAFFAATALADLPLVAALNVTILIALCANGCTAYWLAADMDLDFSSACLVGFIYAGSPFVTAHLLGHYNLIHVWTLPLFALVFQRALRSSSRMLGSAAGLVLGLILYIDYYFLVFALGLGVILVLWQAHPARMSFRGPANRSSLLTFVLLAAAAAVLLCTVVVAVTGGGVISVGSRQVSVRGTFNLLQTFWVLVGIALVTWQRPTLALNSLWRARLLALLPTLAAGTVTAIAVGSPLLTRAIRLAHSGDFVSPAIRWRSGAKGIDVGTMLTGNPFHPVIGPAVRRLYATCSIDSMESVAWLGVVPTLLAIYGGVLVLSRPSRRTTCQMDPARLDAARLWCCVFAVALLWALGPHLIVFGMNTGLTLPQAVLRYVPLFSNARMPGRAMAVAYLALAMISGLAVSELARRLRGRRMVTVLAICLVALDYVAVPFPLVPLPTAPLFGRLVTIARPGAICELPFGLRDGFGEEGTFDARDLFYQTIHGRPMLGGFVARLSPASVRPYREDPFLELLLRMSRRDEKASTASPAMTREETGRSMRRLGISLVVVNRAAATDELIRFVRDTMSLQKLAVDDERDYYVPEY